MTEARWLERVIRAMPARTNFIFPGVANRCRTLWKSIRRDITAFLTLLWRDGALMGRTPQEAFFVKCDDETNPPESIDRGYVVTIIGIAPVKPAEFIVFRIRQHQRGPEIE